MAIPRIYRSIPPSVAAYFTDEYPLGPVTAESISDPASSAFLLNPETDSFKGVMNGASIILGRRGSGKSALLYSLSDRISLRRHLDDNYRDSSTLKGITEAPELQKDYFVTIKIEAPYEMSEVDRIIRTRSLHTLEGAADAWRRRIMHNILLHFINSDSARQILPADLRQDIRNIAALSKGDVKSILKIGGLIAAIKAAHHNRETLLEKLESALRNSKKRALILIDTMEQYRIREDAVSAVVCGLLYEISRHNGNGAIFEIKAALPTEIYKLVKDAGAPGRFALSTEFIHWNPSNLVQIAAHRVMVLSKFRSLSTFENLCTALPKTSYGLDVKASNFVLAEFLGVRIVNEGEQPEEPINTLLRHTMLLPRQLLNTLSFAFKTALRDHKSITVNTEDLADAVSRGSESVISEVFAAYGHVYPDISTVAPPFLRYCGSTASYGELEKAFKASTIGRHNHDYANNFANFLEAMIECGLIGVRGRETPRYIEAKFSYNAAGMPNYTSKDDFVVHPAVRRHYELPAYCPEGRVVLPLGSYIEPL